MYSQNQITNDSTQYSTANYSSTGAYDENYASYVQQQQPPQHQNYNTYQNNYYQYYGSDSTTYQPNYYYNDKTAYQQNDFNPSFQYNDINSTYKSVTPPPPQQTTSSLYPFQSTTLTETTPEKPMNDTPYICRILLLADTCRTYWFYCIRDIRLIREKTVARIT